MLDGDEGTGMASISHLFVFWYAFGASKDLSSPRVFVTREGQVHQFCIFYIYAGRRKIVEHAPMCVVC